MEILSKKSFSTFLGAVLTIAWMVYLLKSIHYVIIFLGVMIWDQDFLSIWSKFQSLPQDMVSFPSTGIMLHVYEQPGNTILLRIFSLTNTLFAVSALVKFITIHNLLLILSTVTKKNPFQYVNVQRIRMIGYIIIGGTFIKAFVSTWLGIIEKDFLRIPYVTIETYHDMDYYSMIFTGLVILVLSEIFRKGAKLKEDSDLTI